MQETKIELEEDGWVITWYQHGQPLGSDGVYDTKEEAIESLKTNHGETYKEVDNG